MLLLVATGIMQMRVYYKPHTGTTQTRVGVTAGYACEHLSLYCSV